MHMVQPVPTLGSPFRRPMPQRLLYTVPAFEAVLSLLGTTRTVRQTEVNSLAKKLGLENSSMRELRVTLAKGGDIKKRPQTDPHRPTFWLLANATTPG